MVEGRFVVRQCIAQFLRLDKVANIYLNLNAKIPDGQCVLALWQLSKSMLQML